MDATLLILAAGMGSRYGGLKQMDEFGPSGETILDYSIYDAINAGFTKVVFVIREFFKDDFKEFFKDKFDEKVEVHFVTQELDKIPSTIALNPDREKPWGTAHAIHVAKDVINEPFAVINADDYYGKESFESLYSFFQKNQLEGREKYSLVGYKLDNTLSKHGTVNRGVCAVDESNNLSRVVETLKIGYSEEGDYCEESFERFLKVRGDELKSEFFIPLLMDELINDGKEQIEVLSCDAQWFGVTYREDKPIVVEKLNRLIAQGVYPLSLWS